jgi:alpha-tubulin suppressor-like RCC1 family protein
MKVFVFFIILGFATNAQVIEVGPGFAILRCQKGAVYSAGSNIDGALGLGTTTSVKQFSPIGLDSIVQVSTHGGHVLALNTQGEVYGWGQNFDAGQLGDSSFLNIFTPVKIISHLDIIQLEAGISHSLFLTRKGVVYGLGSNQFGKLGTPRPPYTHLVPTLINHIDSVIQVSAGFYHSMALKADSSLWTWGLNVMGQLGHGTTVDTAQPLRVSLPAKVVDFDAGTSESYAVTEDGLVYGWGKNSQGELGNAVPRDNNPHPNPMPIPGLNNVVQVEAGFRYALALRKDGTVWAWGRNAFYELGDSTTTNRYTPVQVKNLKHIHSISANVGAAYAIDSMGVIYSWGTSPLGALASGNDTVKPVPTPVPFSACNPVIGIASLESPRSNSLEFYPNPVQEKLFWAGPTSLDKVEIKSLKGKSVWRGENVTELNLHFLKPGVYLIWIQHDNRNMHFKFLKQ